ncbi:hypothetical protein bcgnr5380_60410 [Bacillus cereus]
MSATPKPTLAKDPELTEAVSDAIDVVSNPTDLAINLLVLAAAIAVAVLITRKLKQWVGHQRPKRLVFVEYLATPVLTLAIIGGLSRFGGVLANPLVGLAGSMLGLFAVIRLLGALMEIAFRPTPLLKFMLRLVTVVIWLAAVFSLFEDRSKLIAKVYSAHFKVGGIALSSDGMLNGLISGVVVAIVALWADKSVGNLLRRSRNLQPNFVLALSRVMSVAIWIVATILIFTAADINLTALAAFGGALGIGLGLIVLIWFRQPGLSFVIGSALTINLLTAATGGVLVPITLKRLGFDPALAGGVILTTLTDVMGFLSFLGLATLILLR